MACRRKQCTHEQHSTAAALVCHRRTLSYPTHCGEFLWHSSVLKVDHQTWSRYWESSWEPSQVRVSQLAASHRRTAGLHAAVQGMGTAVTAATARSALCAINPLVRAQARGAVHMARTTGWTTPSAAPAMSVRRPSLSLVRTAVVVPSSGRVEEMAGWIVAVVGWGGAKADQEQSGHHSPRAPSSSISQVLAESGCLQPLQHHGWRRLNE